MIRVETASSASAVDLLRAREAAQLAIQVALGDLQRYAGRDDRVTATAGVLDEDPATTDATEGVDAGSEHWVGVWDTAVLPPHFENGTSSELSLPASKETAALRWLVSGETPQPRQGVLENPVSLGQFAYASFNPSPAGGLDVSAEVRIPRVDIDRAGGAGQDSFAFWVQDAGSAAALQTRQGDTTSLSSPTNANASLDTLVEKQLPRQFPLSLMTPPFDSDPSSQDVKSLQERLFSTAQMGLFGTFDTAPLDLFPRTSAVLANPETGELKKDLSALLRGEEPVPSWGDDKLWLDADIDTELTPSPPSAPRASVLADWATDVSSDGAAPVRAGSYGPSGEVIEPPLHPVLARVQLFIQVTPYEVPSGPPAADETQIPPKFRLHVYPSVQLWNPYDIPIETANYGVEIDSKIDVLVTEIYVNGLGFPTLRGFDGFRDEGADTDRLFPQNLIRFYEDASLLDENAMIFRLKAVELQPGESLVFSPEDYTDLDLAAIRGGDWAGANVLTSEPPFRQFNSFQVDTDVELQTNLDPNRWHLMQPSTPGVARVYHRHATIDGSQTSDISMEARLFDVTDAGEPTLLQEVSDLIWVEHKDGAGAKFEPAWNSAFYEISAPEVNLPQGKGHIFYAKPGRVQFQSTDEEEAHGELIEPFAEALPWAARSGRTPGLTEQRNLSWGGIVASDSQNWFLPDTDTSDPARLRGLTAAIYRLIDLPAGSSGPGSHFFAAHQPADPEEIISLGLFQHFALSANNYFPAYAIGHPASTPGDLMDLANRSIWNDFYLTGAVLPAAADRPYANDRIERAPDAPDAPDAPLQAEHLMQRGALNVNSPYPRAWLSTLAAQFEMDVALTSQTQLTGTSGDTGSPSLQTASSPLLHALRPATGAVDQAGSANPAAWRGHRRISEGDSPESRQLSALAESIASEVRSRGPFASMADFVNSGILQKAINSTSLQVENTPVPSINQDFEPTMRETPGFITQGDLLQALEPALTYRSDTFRIRAYGETRGIDESIKSSVVCEAVVQRLPATHANAALGRRFQIISFTYLDPSTL